MGKNIEGDLRIEGGGPERGQGVAYPDQLHLRTPHPTYELNHRDSEDSILCHLSPQGISSHCYSQNLLALCYFCRPAPFDSRLAYDNLHCFLMSWSLLS